MRDPAPLTRALLKTAFSIHNAIEESLGDERLSLPRVGMLMQLQEKPLRLSELADRLACGRSNMTAMIDRMERDSLVAREIDPGDRRATQIRITKTGAKLCDSAVEKLRRQEQRLRSRLGPAKSASLIESLKMLNS